MPLTQHTIPNVFIIAGLTGSGKTALLNYFIQNGQQAINIESLCRHDGSVFATLQYPTQPSAYDFHKQLNKLWSSLDFNQPVFIEREIHKLGRINLPPWLLHQINTAPVFWLNTSYDLRVKRIGALIQNANPTNFYNCLVKLDKKLGDKNFETAVQFLQHGDYISLAKLLLAYYDHAPGYAYPANKFVTEINIIDSDIASTANNIIQRIDIFKKRSATTLH